MVDPVIIPSSYPQKPYTANPDRDDYLRGTFRVRQDFLPLVDQVLIPLRYIRERERELMVQIEQDYRGQEPLFIPILKGAVKFADGLSQFAEWIDPEYEYMSASSYGTSLSSGKLSVSVTDFRRLLGKLRNRNRPVVIVEDLVDSGQTLSHIRNVLMNIDEIVETSDDWREFRGAGIFAPSDVSICTMMDKREGRKEEFAELPVKYAGFMIPNVWVFGHGLDVWNDCARNIPHICSLKKEFMVSGALEEFFRKLDEKKRIRD